MHPWLEYESGQSWCESSYSKYQTIPFVAEFANTVTNLPIIVLPLLNAFMLRRYISEVNSVIILPHLLLTLNGLASTYYHATLNLFGQLVDELSILWLINICLVAYLPTMKWYPIRYRQHINGMRWTIVLLTTLISALCFLKPSLNAFALMTTSLPAVAIIYYEGIRVGFPAAEKATYGVFILWALATAFWFADRIFCDLWLYLGTPYLHAIFHLRKKLFEGRVWVDYRAGGKLFGVDQKTVVRINQRFEVTGSAKTLLRSGRPRKSSEKNDRALVRIIKKDPLKTATDVTKHANEHLGLGISTRTSRRILKRANLPASLPSKKPWISKKNVKERLSFAHAYKDWPVADWERVLERIEVRSFLFGWDSLCETSARQKK